MIERELDFTTSRTAGLTPAEQVELFKGCEAIIRLHGVGLSNMVFCPPGARVIELFPPTRIWPTFQALAYRCDLQYSAVVLDSDQEIDVVWLRNILTELV